MSSGWIKGSDSRWRTFRAGIMTRDGELCQIRGSRCTDRATEVDHIQPLSLGGEKYDPANCRAACKPCNLDRRIVLTPSTHTPHSHW
jgi:5-methylcytosine-specific restriction endonuclease McrA